MSGDGTAIEIAMPRLSDSMAEATIIRWLRSTGDRVAPGDELAEIETDKAVVGFESEFTGVLEILAAEGESVALGAPIARIHPSGPGPDRRPGPDGSSAPADPPGTAAPARTTASPLVRRIAAELGVDLANVTGTGPHGRIVRADVLAAAARVGQPSDDGTPAATTATSDRGTITVLELSRAQQVVAQRMSEVKATVPEFTATIDVDMQPLVELRDQLRTALGAGPLPTINDFVVAAVSRALREVPRANASYRGGRFELYDRVNVGFAVASADSLMVPVILDADKRSVQAIAVESSRLAARVRDGSITPAEMQDGTFTVSNLGMFGVSHFDAIINPGQAAILAVGAVAERAVVHAGRVAARATASMTLTADHRILYGADAAAFLCAVRDRLQKPAGLLL